MGKNKKTPQVRFKRYNDAWKQRKFGDDLKNIQTGTNKLGSTENSGMPLLKMGNIQRGYFSLEKLEYLYENEEVEPENIVRNGDFFFNTRNTLELVGKGATWFGESGKYAFNSNIARFDLGDIDTVFFNYLYNTEQMQKQVHARAMGTTSVAAIYPRTLDSIIYALPCKEEQVKIGKYLYSLDHLITLLQRKYDKLTNVKKAMLKKMFPKNGSLYPEIRFKGFTGGWEQCKLGDLALFNPKDELPQEFEYVDLESVVGTEMLSHKTEIKATAPSRAQRLARTGDLFYQTVRPYQKNNYLFEKSDNNYVFSTGYAQMRPFVDGYFLLSLVQDESFVKVVLDNCTGTSYPAINASDLAKIVVTVPSDKDEEEKIGVLFRNLDNLITLHQRKLEKLKNMKKSCLEKMFV